MAYGFKDNGIILKTSENACVVTGMENLKLFEEEGSIDFPKFEKPNTNHKYGIKLNDKLYLNNKYDSTIKQWRENKTFTVYAKNEPLLDVNSDEKLLFISSPLQQGRFNDHLDDGTFVQGNLLIYTFYDDRNDGYNTKRYPFFQNGNTVYYKTYVMNDSFTVDFNFLKFNIQPENKKYGAKIFNRIISNKGKELHMLEFNLNSNIKINLNKYIILAIYVGEKQDIAKNVSLNEYDLTISNSQDKYIYYNFSTAYNFQCLKHNRYNNKLVIVCLEK